MELKVEEKKKKHFADLRRYADGAGGGCNDLGGGIKGDVGVALMCEPDSLELCGGVWGVLCVGCVRAATSLALASLWPNGTLNVILSNLMCLQANIFLMN